MPQKTSGPDPWRTPSLRDDKFAPMDLFKRSLTLLVANDLGVFKRLAGGPLSHEELARRLKANPKGIRILLDALVALRYLKKADGLYENEDDTARYLTEESPEFFGTMMSHSYHGLRRWLRLEDVVRKGQRQRHTLPEFQATEGVERRRTKAFTLGLDESSRSTAAIVAETLDLSGVVDMLDVGGGAGVYSIALAKKWPLLKPVVFELPVPARVARRQAKAAGLADRVGVKAGDFHKDDLGAERYDAAFISNIIHIYSADNNRKIIGKVHRALRPGGMIVVKDMFVDDGREAPFHPLMFALTMLMFTDEGDTYTFSEVTQWLREARFARIRRRVIIPRESSLLIGYKK